MKTGHRIIIGNPLSICGITLLFLLLASPFCTGCFGGGSNTATQVAPPSQTPEMQRKAEQLARTLEAIPLRAVTLTERSLEMFAGHQGELIRRIKLLGFNHVCCEVNRNGLEQWRDFIIAATGDGLKCALLFRESDFNRKQRGNQHRFVLQGKVAEEFNDSLPAAHRLSGLVFIAEAHRFTPGNQDRPTDLLFEWLEKNYGIGGDNDMLVKYEYQQFLQLRAEIKNMTLVIGMPDFFLLEAEKGRLSKDTMTKILALGDYNLLYASGSKPSEMEANFSGARKLMPRPPMLGVCLAEHISNEGRSLRRRDWADLNRALNYAISRNKGGVKAILLEPFFNLETLWERDSVPNPLKH